MIYYSTYMKGGKAAAIDGIQTKMLKADGDIVLKRPIHLINMCMKGEKKKVPRDGQRTCIVPSYEGSGYKGTCKNYRERSLLSIPGSVW